MLTNGPMPYRATFSQRGHTFLELLLSATIGMIVMAGLVSFLVQVTVMGGATVQEVRLSQQYRLTLDKLAKEIQRAGYVNWYESWDGCVDQTTPGELDDKNADANVDILDFYVCTTPAIDQFGLVTAFRFPVAGVASSGPPVKCITECDCLLYSYDFNKDGYQGVGSGFADSLQNNANFELFGFRWNDGAVEMRTAGADHACDSGSWRDVNDAYVIVDNLTFTLTYLETAGNGAESAVVQFTGDGSWANEFSGDCLAKDSDTGDLLPVAEDVLCLSSRVIDVALKAHLRNDPEQYVAMGARIKNRNDYLNTALH